MTQESISWGELAELTHATQVEKFNFCTCEDNEGQENPYKDCPTQKPYDRVSAIIAYETGELDGEKTVELFQHLVDTGLAWQLQGHYGRTAVALIEAGLVSKGRQLMKAVQEKTYGQKVLEQLPRNTEIYSIVRSVSASGLSRIIDFYVIVDNKPIWITPAIRDILSYKQDEKTQALKVSGTGMDMCFHVVNSLGYKLHDDGYFFRSERL